MAELFENFGETTLNEALDASETGVDVVDASVMPTAGGSDQYRITIDDEIMIVTNESGNTLTVTRGAEGTTATTHDIGATVRHNLTAASVPAAIDERIATHAAVATAHHSHVLATGIVMEQFITDPPEPVWEEDGTDYVYETL